MVTYWANTISNSLVSKPIHDGNKDVKIIMEDLISGKGLQIQIGEQIVFSQLETIPQLFLLILQLPRFFSLYNGSSSSGSIIKLSLIDGNRSFENVLRYTTLSPPASRLSTLMTSPSFYLPDWDAHTPAKSDLSQW